MNWVSFVAELGDDGVELIESEGFIAGSLVIDTCRVHHLQKVIVIQGLVQSSRNSLELFKVNHSIFVLIKQRKYLAEPIFRLGLSHLRSNNVNKLIPADRLVLLLEAIDKLEDEGVPLVKTEFFEDLIDFGWIDCAASVFVKDVEGALEFIPILGVEAFLPTDGFGFPRSSRLFDSTGCCFSSS